MFGILALLLVVSPPHFQAGQGWLAGSQPAHACSGVSASRCVQASGWASTVRYRDCAICVPHKTLAHLPSGGIVIQLTKAREQPPRAQVGGWPPRIRTRDVQAGFEGVSRRYGVFQLFVRTGHLERSLFVWFGRAHPTRSQIARANAELRTG
jgi:hypothetical protein